LWERKRWVLIKPCVERRGGGCLPSDWEEVSFIVFPLSVVFDVWDGLPGGGGGLDWES